MTIRCAVAAMCAAALALAACSGSSGSSFNWFGSKPAEPAQPADPNALPANYRRQIAGFLQTRLTDRADFQGALISAPVIKPVGESQRYVVCVQFTGHNQQRVKAAIYLYGVMQQYVNPTPEQCGDALYQPFGELAAVAP